MKRKLLLSTISVVTYLLILGIGFTSCSKTSCSKDESYVLQKEDIKVEEPANGGFTINVNMPLNIEVKSVSDEGVSYKWFLDEELISETKNLEYEFKEIGKYNLELSVTQAQQVFKYEFTLNIIPGGVTPPNENSTAYITKVFDFMPAVGQQTNKMPAYVEGDTQESMNAKVLERIGNNKKTMISLGGFGGYVVVGFDHTILNVPEKRDFRVIANAFPNSSEPGVIMVAYDVNKNGVPDDNEWYEIAGSSHVDPTKELWYDKAVIAGNDVKVYRDYEITYYKPKKEPTTTDEMLEYIRWEDNQGKSGFKAKNTFNKQCYFPLWVKGDKLTLKGTCLPQNGVKESLFVLYKFLYGYADNEKNDEAESAIDIQWAVNSKGQRVNLPGVDFIKIYTGVNQENGWLGECSTEITSVEDLHILGVDIDTRK